MKAGSYKLLVADRIIVPFNVSDKAEVADLLVVVPEKPRYAAGQPGGPLAWLANPIVIAGIVAVAIAIPLALHDSSSGGKGHP